MKNWYHSLSPRERVIVLFGGIAAITLLFWMLIAKPLYKNHIKLNKVINNQKTTLKTMKRQSLEITQLQLQNNKPALKAKGSPQQLIERALQTWRLKSSLERMQSQGSKGVRLILTNVNADRAMRFLYELEDKYNLTISKMTVNNNKKEPGFADIRLTIKQN